METQRLKELMNIDQMDWTSEEEKEFRIEKEKSAILTSLGFSDEGLEYKTLEEALDIFNAVQKALFEEINQQFATLHFYKGFYDAAKGTYSKFNESGRRNT